MHVDARLITSSVKHLLHNTVGLFVIILCCSSLTICTAKQFCYLFSTAWLRYYNLLLAHLMGQYCFAPSHLLSSSVICNAAAGRVDGQATDTARGPVRLRPVRATPRFTHRVSKCLPELVILLLEGVQSIAVSMSVCPLTRLKNCMSKLHEIFCTC